MKIHAQPEQGKVVVSVSGAAGALDDLRAALARRGNVKLLTLLALAEGRLGTGTITRRRTIHGTTFEPLSPAGYWQDGSMRCPFEEHLGHVACDYHHYSGCSNDPDDALETGYILAQVEVEARRQADHDRDAQEADAAAPRRP